MRYRDFIGADVQWYKQWFSDEYMNKHLGPFDDDWKECLGALLDYGVYVAQDNEVTIGVIELTLDKAKTHGFSVISGIAINPNLQRRGYAKIIVNDLVRGKIVQNQPNWRAYVFIDNLKAIGLFNKLQWHGALTSDNEITYEWPNKAVQTEHVTGSFQPRSGQEFAAE